MYSDELLEKINERRIIKKDYWSAEEWKKYKIKTHEMISELIN